LNGHQTEYLGGRFFWTNIKDNTTLSFEPRKARISVFTSGSENPHYVEKVISGVRYAITIPFTCNEKLAINIEINELFVLLIFLNIFQNELLDLTTMDLIHVMGI